MLSTYFAVMCVVLGVTTVIVAVAPSQTARGYHRAAAVADYAESSLPVRVILDHDGGVDDFITMMLLLAQPQKVDVLAVTVIDGDCIADIAVNSTIKLLHLLGRHDIPVALSTLQAVNPFPQRYRAQGLSIDVLPMLNHHNPADVAVLKARQLVGEPGQEYLAQLLLQQQEPVTLVITGPLSNLAYALDKYPETAAKVARVWWMGGALRVPGNVYEPNSDGSAEWNAFWDPAAMGVVWNSSVPLTLVPLDGTNKVPITPDLLYSFGPQASYTYSALAGTLYAPVVNWVFNTPTASDPYFAWDVLTAACMLDGSELCEIEHGLDTAAVLSGPGQGATVLLDTTQQQRQLVAATEAAVQQDPLAVQEGLGFDVESASAAERIAAASALAAAAAARGIQNYQHNGAALRDLAGVDVSGHLSAVKRVSAVVNVDPQEFNRYLLQAFRQ